jgi:anti-sigma factor RsiW
MRFSDEMLMAYADGELDLVASAEIEAAMAKDPAVARAVERHRNLAGKVRVAYDGVLEEPVPAELAALVADPGDARVVELAAARGARRIAVGRWQLPAWTAMAASVLLGLLVGLLLFRGSSTPYEETGRGLIARGELAEGSRTLLRRRANQTSTSASASAAATESSAAASRMSPRRRSRDSPAATARTGRSACSRRRRLRPANCARQRRCRWPCFRPWMPRSPVSR